MNNMKKILTIILIAIISFNTVYANNETINSASNDVVVQSTLAKKIKELFDNEVFTIVLEGKKIQTVLKEEIQNMSEEDKAQCLKEAPWLSFDESNFDSEYSTYIWLAELVKSSLKLAIETEQITQEYLNEIRTMFIALIGTQVPEITVHKSMTDEEIERLAESLVDLIKTLTDTSRLKSLGIDIYNKETIDSIKKQFNISLKP